jgi:acyl carrier protein phosphodiesterase
VNFLAHLWLAEQTKTSLAGAVLGDVVRGANLTAYPDEIAMAFVCIAESTRRRTAIP